jgi:signal transduction histidine kinase
MTVAMRTEARLPEQVEVTSYYLVSEALTNVAKHAHASQVRVSLDEDDGWIVLTIGDDGVGGADPSQGSGLIGLRDRVEALGGTLEVHSEANAGTVLTAQIPVAAQTAAGGDV